MEKSRSGLAAFVICILFLNGPASSATKACLQDPRKCSPQELCSNEILGRHGELSFSYKEHAKRAQELGLSCAPKKVAPSVRLENPLDPMIGL